LGGDIAMNRIILLLLLATFGALGCAPTLDIEPETVEADIASVLEPGASAEEIETCLRERGLTFSYDRFQNRYQSIIRHPKSNFHAITIVVHLDERRKFKSVEARDSYTFL
jgi:hypothetical protein